MRMLGGQQLSRLDEDMADDDELAEGPVSAPAWHQNLLSSSPFFCVPGGIRSRASPRGTGRSLLMDLARLPTEVTARIVSQLPVQTLVRLMLVSRAWRQLCCDDELWTSVWLLRDRVPKPRRPRGTVHAALIKAELAANWRQQLANDELLRKCYLMLCQSDCPQRIRSELSRVSATALDINHRHSLTTRWPTWPRAAELCAV
jgi:F-box-like